MSEIILRKVTYGSEEPLDTIIEYTEDGVDDVLILSGEFEAEEESINEDKNEIIWSQVFRVLEDKGDLTDGEEYVSLIWKFSIKDNDWYFDEHSDVDLSLFDWVGCLSAIRVNHNEFNFKNILTEGDNYV